MLKKKKKFLRSQGDESSDGKNLPNEDYLLQRPTHGNMSRASQNIKDEERCLKRKKKAVTYKGV